MLRDSIFAQAKLTVAANDTVLASLQLKGGQCCDLNRKRVINAKAMAYGEPIHGTSSSGSSAASTRFIHQLPAGALLDFYEVTFIRVKPIMPRELRELYAVLVSELRILVALHTLHQPFFFLAYKFQNQIESIVYQKTKRAWCRTDCQVKCSKSTSQSVI